MLIQNIYSVGHTLFKCITNSVFEQNPCIDFPTFTHAASIPMTERLVQPKNQNLTTIGLSQEAQPSHNPDIRTISPSSVIEIALSEHSNPTYHEITRRIPREELAAIEAEMQSLSPSDHTTFLQLVKDGKLVEIIGEEDIPGIKNYPLHALYAVKQGTLSVEDFATIIMPWASQDPEKTCIPIFIDGAVNLEAREAIERTLILAGRPLLSSEELEEFFQEMEKLPKLQQHFWLEKARDDQISLPSVREGIFREFKGLNVFSKVEDHLMIPSSGMMQTFLNTKFKENAVHMNFVLGLSSTDDIERNGSTNTRDAALRFPGTTLVKTSDNYAALETDFTYHDFFHAIQTSSFSPTTRKLITKTAQFVGLIKQDDPTLDDLYHTLIDMENPELLRVITKKQIDTSILDRFSFVTLSNISDTKPSFYSTCLIIHNIACHILEHSELLITEPLSFINFLGLTAITLIRSLCPFSRTPKIDLMENLKTQLSLYITELEQKKETTTSSKQQIAKLKNELASIEKGTHPLQG